MEFVAGRVLATFLWSKVMTKNSQSAKTDAPKAQSIVQTANDAPEGLLLSEADKSPEVLENQSSAKPAEPELNGEEQFVEVRVLTLCQLGVANDVVEVPTDSLSGLKSLGYVDDHPDAVAFAKALKEPKV
jgi:hypothetical protein